MISMQHQQAAITHTITHSLSFTHTLSRSHTLTHVHLGHAPSHAGKAKASTAPAYSQLLALLQSSYSAAVRAGGARGRSAGGGATASSSAPRMWLLVLDEVDRLLARGSDDVYRLFSLPYLSGEAGGVRREY